MALRPGFVVFPSSLCTWPIRIQRVVVSDIAHFLSCRTIHHQKLFIGRQLLQAAFPSIHSHSRRPLVAQSFTGLSCLQQNVAILELWEVGPAAAILQSFPLLQIGFRKTTEIMVDVRERHWWRHHRFVFLAPNMIILANTETHFHTTLPPSCPLAVICVHLYPPALCQSLGSFIIICLAFGFARHPRHKYVVKQADDSIDIELVGLIEGS